MAMKGLQVLQRWWGGVVFCRREDGPGDGVDVYRSIGRGSREK